MIVGRDCVYVIARIPRHSLAWIAPGSESRRRHSSSGFRCREQKEPGTADVGAQIEDTLDVDETIASLYQYSSCRFCFLGLVAAAETIMATTCHA